MYSDCSFMFLNFISFLTFACTCVLSLLKGNGRMRKIMICAFFSFMLLRNIKYHSHSKMATMKKKIENIDPELEKKGRMIVLILEYLATSHQLLPFASLLDFTGKRKVAVNFYSAYITHLPTFQVASMSLT